MVSLNISKPSNEKIAPRVEIIGVFGSGKTTFVNNLSKLGIFQKLLENHEKNPFWGDDESIGITGYLPYDLSFLIQHAHLSCKVKKNDTPTISICDWSFSTDYLWASMRLGEELGAYEKVYNNIIKNIGSPIGYFYLEQTPEIIVKRIIGRGRAPEISFYKFVEKAVLAISDLASAMKNSGENITIIGDSDTTLSHLENIAWLKN